MKEFFVLLKNVLWANKLTIIGLAFLFLAGLTPLLWYRPGFIYANGDEFPIFLNAAKTFSSGLNTWSPDYLGYASPMPSLILYQYLGGFLIFSGLSLGFIQVLLQALLLVGAGFSMFYLTQLVYPGHKVAPLFAGFFYIFNFFVLQSRLNLGFAWTYTFLPLLLALFVKVVNDAYRQDKKSKNGSVILMGLLSVVALSVASINPANIVLFLLAFSVFALYFLFKHRRNVRPFLSAIGKLSLVIFFVNLWWFLPMLNTFIFSPQGLNPQISVAAWSWTHGRSSFLNLFWFNGGWGWLPEYVPYFDFYSNPIVLFLVFIPFILAGSALLVKRKSVFNAYVMGWVLFFVFLGKGLHEPFGSINLFLYQNVPLMDMFREPASKFTLLIMPFVALLIGSTCEGLANIRITINCRKLRLAKVFLLLFIAVSLVISAFPLLTNPIRTDGQEDFDFSWYVEIPNYWFEAAAWINSQSGDGAILITPLNDFYQMPYEWGYYGTDQLLERFFNRPIISSAALDGYATSSDTANMLKGLKASVRFNHTEEFKTLLDLLSVEYILQRNDVRSNMEGRNLMSSDQMKIFFGHQPHLRLVKSFGELDIYSYTDFKPPISSFSLSFLQSKDDIQIDIVSINKSWNFSLAPDFVEWILAVTSSNQSQVNLMISQDRSYFRVDMWNSTSGWGMVNSPLIEASFECSYSIKAGVGIENASQIMVRIVEYSSSLNQISDTLMQQLIYTNETIWKYVQLIHEIDNADVEFFEVQFWTYFDAAETNSSTLWLENVDLTGEIININMTGFENPFENISDVNAELLSVQKIGPLKTLVTVDAHQPFVLATSQVLDRFWVAHVNGEKIRPDSLYLGLKGFLINDTGLIDIVIEYEPQIWFNRSLMISGISALFILFTFLFFKIIKSVFLTRFRFA
jgi:hypothetical protein